MFLWFGIVMFAVGVLATWAVLDAMFIGPLQAQVDEMQKHADRMWVRRWADELGYAHHRNTRPHLGTPYLPSREGKLTLYADGYLEDTGDHSKSAELRSV